MGDRKAYPSDLTAEQWAVVGPFLDAWKARHPSVSGHQSRYELREIVNTSWRSTARSLGIDIEVVKRSDTLPRFVPVKHRWVVEQTNGTLMLHRRLTREYESRPASSVSRTLWASTENLVRWLTGTSTPSWRNPARSPA